MFPPLSTAGYAFFFGHGDSPVKSFSITPLLILVRLIPLLSVALLAACNDTPLITQPENAGPPMLMPALVELVSEPIIQPIGGNLVNAATTLGKASVLEDTRVEPLGGFSQTAVSRLATSQLNLVVTDR
jgi:hypothetical protein